MQEPYLLFPFSLPNQELVLASFTFSLRFLYHIWGCGGRGRPNSGKTLLFLYLFHTRIGFERRTEHSQTFQPWTCSCCSPAGMAVGLVNAYLSSFQPNPLMGWQLRSVRDGGSAGTSSFVLYLCFSAMRVNYSTGFSPLAPAHNVRLHITARDPPTTAYSRNFSYRFHLTASEFLRAGWQGDGPRITPSYGEPTEGRRMALIGADLFHRRSRRERRAMGVRPERWR